MRVRGVRGAISVTENSRQAIVAATRELLGEMLKSNAITDFEDIASVIFTTTVDLTATFPAEAARELGMHQVPLLCASEINVPDRLPRCVRVLMHWNTTKAQKDIIHVYLGDAKTLRPDIHSAQ